MIQYTRQQRPHRPRSESFRDWEESENTRKRRATRKARETLSPPALRFWNKMCEFRRPEHDPEGVERQAKKAATNGHGRIPDQGPLLRRWAAELVRLRYAKHGTQVDNGDVRRGCPWCRSSVRWLIVRGRVEAPWCSRCGPLGFWLVYRAGIDGLEPIGYGGHSTAGMW